MKKQSFLGIALLMSMCTLSLITKGQNTVLSGELKGLSGGTVKVFFNKGDSSRTESITASGDSFTWKINLDEPLRVALTVGRNNYYFFAQPGHIDLTGIKDSTQTYVLSGSPMQQDADAFNLFIKDLTEQRDRLNAKFKNATAEEKALIEKERNILKKERYKKTREFIAVHPTSFFSLYLISLYREYDEIKPLYGALGQSAKQTVQGQRFAKNLAVLEKNQLGMQMTDFTQSDIKGHPVKFASFKGKYVLVDFWASWCMPCRAENPNVLKAYNAFKDKGFTVIGISLDDKAANWKKAVRDDKMPWTQLSDLKGWKNDLSVSLGIQAIPSNFLIDPSGKIIAKDLRGKMLEDKLKELLN